MQPLFLDLDSVLLADPWPLLRSLPEADLLISSDQMHPGEVVRGLEPCPVPGMQGYHMGFMNVGMAAWRPGALPLLQVRLGDASASRMCCPSSHVAQCESVMLAGMRISFCRPVGRSGSAP